MERIYLRGGARAIGVSNFERNHLDDIFSMKGLIPAVNQVTTTTKRSVEMDSGARLRATGQ